MITNIGNEILVLSETEHALECPSTTQFHKSCNIVPWADHIYNKKCMEDMSRGSKNIRGKTVMKNEP
jgi:hypothetical protein